MLAAAGMLAMAGDHKRGDSVTFFRAAKNLHIPVVQAAEEMVVLEAAAAAT